MFLAFFFFFFVRNFKRKNKKKKWKTLKTIELQMSYLLITKSCKNLLFKSISSLSFFGIYKKKEFTTVMDKKK